MRLAALLLVVLAGLVLRLDHAWNGAPENLPDSAAYERLARGLATDGEYEQKGPGLPPWTQPASNYSPGLPLMIGGLFASTGTDDPRAARILLALLGSLAIPATFLIGRRLTGYWGALAGAALVAFYPTLITDSGMVLTEGLAGLLIALALLALFRVERAKPGAGWILPGLLFGLGAMVRPEFLAVAVVVAATTGLAHRREGYSRALAGPAILLASAALVIAPWTVRNAIELDRFVPISTGGGQALFTGSYLPSDGDPQQLLPALFERRPGLASDPFLTGTPPPPGKQPPEDQVLTALALREDRITEPDATLARLGREQYLDALTGQPLRLAGFFAQKGYHVWLRGRAGLTGNLPGRLFHWAIVAFFLAGLWQVWRTRPVEFRILAAVVGTVAVIGLLLIASPRRVLAIWPVVAALAGCGLALAGSIPARLIEGRAGPRPLP
ncbi:MAG: glycosyltransferase family 39 protein [Solirubrobacterales bacterium]